MSKLLSFKYEFRMDDGKNFQYVVEIDPETMTTVSNESEPLPEWTKLSENQCSHCPLKTSSSPRCPLAVNIHHLIKHFSDLKSFTVCEMIVETEDRTYSKQTDIQRGLGAIFGLMMPTSGCPKLSFLKPMARFHLPFSNLEETVFRSLGSFLIGKFLTGDPLDRDEILQDLQQKYDDIAIVNQHIVSRLHQVKQGRQQVGDADVNAVVVLDSLGAILHYELSSDLASLYPLYETIKK